jgi:hypothetical protein
MVLNSMSCPKVVGMWCAGATALGALAIATGTALTVGNGAWWLSTCLVPPAIMLLVWRGPPALTVAEILHSVDTSTNKGSR